MAAREDLEFRGLQFQHHGSRNPAFVAQRCCPGQLGKSADRGLRLGEQHVVFELGWESDVRKMWWS